MRNVLVLGAGLVSRPLLRYLLTHHDYRVYVGTADEPAARRVMGEHPRGRIGPVDARDEASLGPLVDEADVVVSLLPAELNPGVARVCIARRKPFINTSYAAPEMWALDEEARAAGVLLLNELGLDPGIDHMSTAAMVRRLRYANGTITSFTSSCGGFPASDANTNPWGYKFSWRPRAVMMAGRKPAAFRRHGEAVRIPGEQLFEHRWSYEFEGQGIFEVYPNRDTLFYLPRYGLAQVPGGVRGTLRYPGWCATMGAAARLGLFEVEEQAWPAGMTYRDFSARRLPKGGGSVLAKAAEYLGVSLDSEVLARLEWAGLFSDREVPERSASPIDVFGNRLARLMMYQPGERDMVLLKNVFLVEYPDGSREQLTTRLVQLGEAWGDSAMSRTVSLAAGIGTRLILEKGVQAVGVQIPTLREIYEPVLEELEERGIRLEETRLKAFRGPLS
ncbi:MAG: saccharopine dehydrogenase C-terminal domain-containing protein [Gemmatimonadales bacterium]